MPPIAELELLLNAFAERRSVWDSAELRTAFFHLARSVSSSGDVIFDMDGFTNEADFHACGISDAFWGGAPKVLQHAFRTHGWVPEAFADADRKRIGASKRIATYSEAHDGVEDILQRAFQATSSDEIRRHTRRLALSGDTAAIENTCSLLGAFADAMDDAGQVDALVPFLDPAVPRLSPVLVLGGGRCLATLRALFLTPESARRYLVMFVGAQGWEASPWLVARFHEARGIALGELEHRVSPYYVHGLIKQLHTTWPTLDRASWLEEFAGSEGEYAEALALAEQATTLGDDAALRCETYRGLLLLEAGDPDSARVILDAVIEANEDYADFIEDSLEGESQFLFSLAYQRREFPQVIPATAARLPDDPEYAHLANYLEPTAELGLSDEVRDLLSGLGVTHVHQLTSIEEHTIRGTEFWPHWRHVCVALQAGGLSHGFTPGAIYGTVD